MIRSAVLGRDIKYTLSPRIHSLIARACGIELDFKTVDVPYDELHGALDLLMREVDGFFITKPYKTDVARYLALEGSVNFVRCRDRAAFSTDGAGFIRAIDRSFPGWREKVNGVLVLGAGGAAQSVCEALVAAGKKVYILNRTLMHAVKLTKTGAELYSNQPAEMAVNCTTVGMNGTDDVLKSLCVLPDFAYAYDLIYSQRTPFLRRTAAAGAITADGLDMLIYQAIEGDRMFFGTDMDVDGVFEFVYKKIVEERR